MCSSEGSICLLYSFPKNEIIKTLISEEQSNEEKLRFSIYPKQEYYIFKTIEDLKQLILNILK